jgi:hypothetical protein
MNVFKFLIEKNCKIIFMHTDVELKYILTPFLIEMTCAFLSLS